MLTFKTCTCGKKNLLKSQMLMPKLPFSQSAAICCVTVKRSCFKKSFLNSGKKIFFFQNTKFFLNFSVNHVSLFSCAVSLGCCLRLNVPQKRSLYVLFKAPNSFLQIDKTQKDSASEHCWHSLQQA